jgi:hypothetical protein
MPLNFEEAEARFRELQARVQRGESISRAQYEDEVSRLAVQDKNGVLWEINPRTAKWMYFDGAEWVSGAPPGHDTSAVIPRSELAQQLGAPPPPPSAPRIPTPPPAPSAPRMTTPPPPPAPSVPPRPVTPPKSSAPPNAKTSPESLKPYVRPQERIAPPPSLGAPEERPARPSPLGMFGPNREWIPLAIIAVVLLLCAIIVLVGGQFALGAFGVKPTNTPTRTPTSLPTTPIPTIVRLPSPTPIPPTPVPVLAKINERLVNVRAGPSTKNKIITQLKRDTQITLIGRNEDSTWYQVNIAGQAEPGWIFGETLQITSGNPSTLPVAGAGTPAAPAPTPSLAPLGTFPTPTLKP